MIAVVGTVVGFAARFHWTADIAVQFRVQYVFLFLPAVGFWMVQRSYKTLIVGGVVLAINMWPILPYFRPQNRKPSASSALPQSSQTSLRIPAMNVLRTNKNFPATLEEIVGENADFVFLMEVQPAWKAQLENLRDRYPHQRLLCREDYTGVAFLSKHPWNSFEIAAINDIANPPLDIRFSALPTHPTGFRMILTHPLPYSTPVNEASLVS